MRIRIIRHAFKHGLTERQIVAAFESGFNGATIRARDSGTEPQRFATIGFDDQTRAIELVFVRSEDGGQVAIFHARYATKEFRREIAKGVHHG